MNRIIKKLTIIVFSVAVACLLIVCIGRANVEEYEWNGQTMGTYYRVLVVGASISESDELAIEEEIDSLLDRINGWMSTFDPASEISRFNASTSTNIFAVTPDFAVVTALALDVAQKSGGAFDPTVAPLVDLWGFGKKGESSVVPKQDSIDETRDRVGYVRLSVDLSGVLCKHLPHLELDLSAVAKGYGVDMVARLLMSHGYKNVLVDIGGEIVAHGVNAKKQPWHVSIETPIKGTGLGVGYYRILSLSGMAVATSGDYRNYFDSGNTTYSHIIDPRTGYPVTNGVASVTVIANDCMTADALATALTVLGPTEGLELLTEYSGVKAMWIMRDAKGTFSDVISEGFAEYFVESKETI